MVIVNLIGGLGNQLFQYAFGRSLSYRLNCPMALSTLFLESKLLAKYRGYTLRYYELEPFCVHPIRLSTNQSFLQYGRAINPFCTGARIITEANLTNNSRQESLLVSMGYWQSENYFADCADLIRQDLSFCQPITAHSQQFLDAMQTHTAVSLHIRRGDYVTNSQANKAHGLCGLDYYERAIDYVCKHYADVHFYVFSDDLAWASQHLPYLLGPATTYVDNTEGRKNWEDMYLMSHCQHHITANSSFSWWGAWLNPSPNKLVVAPIKWFTQIVSPFEANDVTPSGWIRI